MCGGEWCVWRGVVCVEGSDVSGGEWFLGKKAQQHVCSIYMHRYKCPDLDFIILCALYGMWL